MPWLHEHRDAIPRHPTAAGPRSRLAAGVGDGRLPDFVLVTPHLETAQWVMGLWRERPAVDPIRIEQGLAPVLAHRKAIEGSFSKGWPGFAPAFCEPGQKPDHGKDRTWVTGFMDIGEPFDERDDANEIRDEHAALIARALVGMRKLALMRTWSGFGQMSSEPVRQRFFS